MSRLNPAVAVSIGALLGLAACGGSSETSAAEGPKVQATQQAAPTDDSTGDSGSVDDFCAAAEKLDALDLEDVTAAEATQLEGLVDELKASAPSDLREDVTLYYGEILKLAKAGTALEDSTSTSSKLQQAMGNVFSYGVDHCYQDDQPSASAPLGWTWNDGGITAMDDWEAPSV